MPEGCSVGRYPGFASASGGWIAAEDKTKSTTEWMATDNRRKYGRRGKFSQNMWRSEWDLLFNKHIAYCLSSRHCTAIGEYESTVPVTSSAGTSGEWKREREEKGMSYMVHHTCQLSRLPYSHHSLSIGISDSSMGIVARGCPNQQFPLRGS